MTPLISNTIMMLHLGVFMLLCASPLRADTNVSHVFLVQNSGWMLPFYEDAPDSNFFKLVVDLTKRVSKYGNPEQIVASFNQSTGENKSPKWVYQGDNAGLQAAVQSIQLARKPGKGYADTDFKEAIVGAVSQFSPGKSCLLWIITNNKNSPNNSEETSKNNKVFYNFLREANEIKRIVAFLRPMKVQSSSRKDYRANGLMIYALAYGEPADQLLRKMLAEKIPFSEQPARLKPLNAEALTFSPVERKSNNVEARLAKESKTLVLTFSGDNKPETAELTGQLRNDFYPYDIQSAEITINTDGFKSKGNEQITAELSTKGITNIPAGGLSSDINFKIKIPALPSLWDPEVIFRSDYKSQGVILFNLENQKLAISKEFTQSVAKIFPGDPLPEMFEPGLSSKKSVTRQAVTIRVQYPIWPFLVLTSLGLMLAGVISGGIKFMRHEKFFRLSIDGVPRAYRLKPFSEIDIKDQQGARIGVLRRGLGQALPLLDKGKTNSVSVT